MQYQEVVKVLAPCGLNCQKCFAYKNGDIQSLSLELQKLLGSFDNYATRFKTILSMPVFGNYPAFKELLAFLAEPHCNGCRNGQCMHMSCGVITCYKEKGVDFCFQCDEFPCDKSNFDSDLKRRWIETNHRMKTIGVVEYYLEIKDLPRYR